MPAGHCRGCGHSIDKAREPRARTWHAECAAAWRDQHPGHQRSALWDRDQGVCASCSTTPAERQADWRAGLIPSRDVGWESDHVVPLWAGGLNSVANLQTLCPPCHRGKTAAEAAARAVRAKETTACASPS